MEFTTRIDGDLWKFRIEDSGLFEAELLNGQGAPRIFGVVSQSLVVHLDPPPLRDRGLTMGSMDWTGPTMASNVSDIQPGNWEIAKALREELYRGLDVIVNGDWRIRQQILAEHPGIGYMHHPSKGRQVKVIQKEGFKFPRFVDVEGFLESVTASIESSIRRSRGL